MSETAVKKIVIIGPAHPYRGGIAAFNERMAIELNQADVDTSIWTFTMQYPAFLFPGKSQYTDETQPQGVHIDRKLHSLNPFNWVSLGYQLRKIKPDVIILRYWMPFFSPALSTIARISRSKVILLADNIIPHESRLGDTALTKLILSSVDAVMVLSQAVANDVKTLKSDIPILYHPHPIFNQFGNTVDRAAACSHLHLDASKKYLLFFGFIREYKGLDLLIEALATLADRQADTELIIAGEFYGNEDKYKALVAELNLEDRCHFFNTFIADDQVKYFFSAADVLVLPYKSATQSGVTQIAYHFNKPMIATKVGGLSEYIDEGEQGLLCDVNAKAIATSIEAFYSENKQQSMVNRIVETKARYSWQSFTNSLTDFCAELLSGPNK